MSLNNFLSGLPMIGGLFDNTDEQAMQELEKNKALYGGLAPPDLAHLEGIPNLYNYVGDYSPDAAQYQTISDDPRLKSYQMDNLAKLAGLADTGLSDADQLGYLKAKAAGHQLAKSGNDAAIQNAQARGVAGGGLEFALREMANQDGANRAQEAGLQQAADSARQRALYQQAYGNELSQVRGQDFSNNAANANIINQFNQMNTQARNQAQQLNNSNRQQLQNANAD